MEEERERAVAEAPGAQRRALTIAGGGIAAIEAVLALRALGADVEIELLAPLSAFEYRPLSILEPFSRGEAPELDLARFAEEQRIEVVRDTLAAVDPEERTIATGRGARRGYDLLLVATGAIALEGVPGAQLFRGRADRARVAQLLGEYERRRLRRLVVAVPTGSVWTLPAYELALLTASELRARGVGGVELVVVTPERGPLDLFGRDASAEVARLLREAGVSVKGSTHPVRFEGGALRTRPEGAIRTDRTVALPRLVGGRFAGLPADLDGFVPTDEHGRVRGIDGVYAAGDVTTFPVKQGGIACQQADAAADSIAAVTGAELEPEPFRPVLRGLLLSGTTARYLESGGAGDREDGSPPRFALWEPSSKVFGRHLLPYMWEAMGHGPLAPRGERAIPVDFDFESARSLAGA